MKQIYLDNAATTALRPEVIAAMVSSLESDYGNPSSTHAIGRPSKSAVELARKSVAKILNCSAQEIIFTAGATEASNLILRSAVRDLGVKRIITSRIEHHAVLYTVESLKKEFGTAVDYVKIKSTGTPDLTHLAELLSDEVPTLVSIMHVNNEVGTVIDLDAVGRICKQHRAYFHSDTVQSIGKCEIDLQQLPADFIVASAHKFHGPKGAGFAFIRKGLPIRASIYGGEQEKGMRAGTESVHNIVGLAKALEISISALATERQYISGLRDYAVKSVMENFPGVKINGDLHGFYNILNVCLPLSEDKTSMILFHLDLNGIAVSRGSACQSGSVKASHVLSEILDAADLKKPSLRISFSHFNTIDEIDTLISVLKKL